jgi:hypothetical protein
MHSSRDLLPPGVCSHKPLQTLRISKSFGSENERLIEKQPYLHVGGRA